jgi:predicted ATPase/class 3 adenylate cyclase
LVAGWCGLRFGELAALRRGDVDLLHGRLSVARSVAELGSGRLVENAPKRKAGRRTIAVPATLVAVLEEHLAGFVGPDADDRVFTAPRCGPLRRSNFADDFRESVAAAGLPAVRFHDLRHAAGTLAAQLGATERELQARLGHASNAAARRYQHAAQSRDREAQSPCSMLRFTGSGRPAADGSSGRVGVRGCSVMVAGGGGRPTGTVSFLFTDIVGSTSLWERHPEAMRQALARHDLVLRSAIDAHRGFVFSTGGDAFCAAFERAGEAIGAALEAQRALQLESWPQDARVAVRMGVHTGEAHERDGAYFGSAVNRAARLMGLAHGGQVLVSMAVQEVVRDELPHDVSLRGLGEHRLRGLSRPETVFQLIATGLSDVFPPLAAGTSVPGNLPSPPTSFVGRNDEVKRLTAEIPTSRLVTLVGPGGVGKTRLSIEVAAAGAEDFSDGVWFVELASLAGADAVLHAVASTLSVSPEAGSTLLQSIVRSLRGQRMLIVLDNCEHVIDAAAGIAAAVIREAPTVTILASSRERLAVGGERVWAVSALDSAVEAVELFCERAAAADQRFEPANEDMAVIRRICARLDGMPLAVELAAVRARSMSLEQLAERLDDRFRLLRSSARGGPERHQTLRATVEWSYQLLTSDEQVVFDRLSVFAGSFDLKAAEAVCGGRPLDRFDVVDLLVSLVDKSLVAVDRLTGRYRLLEMLRQYGAEQLEGRGQVDTLRSEHLAHFLEVAGHARRLLHGDSYVEGVAVFEAEWDNLRAAVDWAAERGDAVAASTLVVAPFWYAVFFLRHELGAWAELVRPLRGVSPAVHGVRAYFAFMKGDVDGTYQRARDGIAGAPTPTHPDTAICWQAKISSDAALGRHDCVRNEITTYAAAATDIEDPYSAAVQFALLALFPTDPGQAQGFVTAAKDRSAGIANPSLAVMIGVAEAVAAFAAGRHAESAALFREAGRHTDAAGPYPRAIVTWMIALRAAAPGFGMDPASAYREAITLLRDLQEWANLWTTVESLATWWARTGSLEQAATAMGYLDRAGRRFFNLAARRAHADQLIGEDPDAARWRANGAEMSRDHIISYCLEHLA